MRERDITGKRFGKLIAIKRDGTCGQGPTWRCQCDCGNVVVAHKGRIISGKTKSCGCLRAERFRTHGMRRTRVYGIWSGMMTRCFNNQAESWRRYGKVGITVCDQWKDFAVFFADMGLPPSNRHQIDRIDGTKGYERTNCRWVTKEEQMRNRSNAVIMSFQGDRLSVLDWAARIGIPAEVLRSRRLQGWTDEATLTRPLRARQHLFLFQDQIYDRTHLSKVLGVAYTTLRKRIKLGPINAVSYLGTNRSARKKINEYHPLASDCVGIIR